MMSGIFNVSIEILDGNGDFFSTYSIIDIRENRIPQAQFSISSEEIIAGQIIYFLVYWINRQWKCNFFLGLWRWI